MPAAVKVALRETFSEKTSVPVTRPITIRDVARRAEVGVGTVSRVMSNSPKVAAETRERVLRAAEELNYVPNSVAGSLASRRTRVVAMLVPTLGNSIFAETVDGAAERLTQDGFQLMLGNTGYSQELEDQLTLAFLGRRPEGLILTGTRHSPTTLRVLHDAGIPIVETWELPETALDLAVGFSNANAARDMTAHMLARGYRQIVMLGRPPGMERRNDQRLQGYAGAMQAQGLSPRFVHSSRPLDQHMTAGAAGLHDLRREYPDADAVFCADDIHAAGLLFECQRLGLAVPDDLAIAGFGDFPVAAGVHPRLTTVRIPGHDIGRTAAELILDRRNGADIPDTSFDLGYEIIPRETT